MNSDGERADNLAKRVADEEPIDWAVELLASHSPEERETLRAFRTIAAVGALHRQASEPLSTEQPSAPPTWGPLSIRHELGRGQFGTVYTAWDPRLERQVALKLLDPRESHGAGKAIREARLLARIQHPNVLTVYGAEEIDGRVGIWTELVDGCTLEDELAARGPLPPAEVMAIGVVLCQALAAVHDAGLLHRDIKTQNVMRDRAGRIVLMDFGAGGDTVTLASRDTLVGTPLYLAPELFEGEPSTVAADIYATGVTLFRLLTGRFPLEGRTFNEVRLAHRQRSPASLESILPGVPRPLTTACDKALAPNPRHRFDDARAFASALSLARDSTTAAAEPSRLIRKWPPAILLALVTAALVGELSWRPPTGGDPPAASEAPATIVVRQILPELAPDLPSNPSMRQPAIARLDPDSADLVLTDLTTGVTQRLHVNDDGPASPGLPEHSALTPDGSRLAFAWEQDNIGELRVLDIARHRVVSVVRRPAESIVPFQWTGDGRLVVALVVGRGGLARAAMFAPDTGTEQPITSFADVPLTISLSPDGHWLAYDQPSTSDTAHRDIGVVNTATGFTRTLVDHPADDVFPMWTPDGDALVFASSRTGTLGLWMVPVRGGTATGQPRLVKDDIGRMWPLGFSSADTMYFTATSGYVDVFTVPTTADGTVAATPQPVTRRVLGANISPAWSPDGRRLAYVSDRREGGDRQARALVVDDLTSGIHQTIVPDLRFFIGPRWSADGTSVVVKGADGAGRWGLHRVRLSDGAAEPLLLNTDIGQYGWGAGGQIYYVLRGRIMVHQRAIGAGADADAVLLDTGMPAITRLAVSQATGAVAYSAISREDGVAKSVLRVHDASGDREVFATALPETVLCESWSPDGEQVLFSRYREAAATAPELLRISSRGGEPRSFGLQLDGLREVSLNTQGWLAFTSGLQSRSLWAVEHLPRHP